MNKNIEKDNPAPEIITGNFGAIKTIITDPFIPWISSSKVTTSKKVQRYSYDGDLVIEILFFSSPDNTETSFYIHPKFIVNSRPWTIDLYFQNIGNSCGFAGMFGAYGLPYHSHHPIPSDIYVSIQEKVEKICNPDFDYGNQYHSYAIDDIINLLHKCNNKEINRHFLSHWDKRIAKMQESHKEKNPKNLSND